AANSPPSVTLTAPAAGASYTAPATINLTASASASGSASIGKVEFYAGSTLVGSATSAPYTASWSNVAAGSYTLTAKATDSLGASTTSAAVNVSVNVAPTVSITVPADGAVFTAPASIAITAVASSTASLSKVELFHDGVSLGAATPPANTKNFTLYATWNVSTAGTYALTAQATDSGGALSTSAPVHVTVNAPPPPPHQPPVITIT